MRKNYLLFVSFLQAQMERNFYYPLSVDTDLQFLRFFFFLFTRIGVLSDLKKKKEIIPLKKNRKRREKKNILRDKRLPEFVYFLLYHVFIEG